jgi:fructose-1,6-bisphosphatase I
MDTSHEIVGALKDASVEIYNHVKSGEGLKVLKSANMSGDDQIGLDIFADLAFRNRLKDISSVSRVVSEEGDDMTKLRDAQYSVALDPIDGSKSALVGIPCGAIFAVFQNVDSLHDFKGANVVSSGFFIFGINLEMYITTENGVTQFEYDEKSNSWTEKKTFSQVNEKNVMSINSSGRPYWTEGMRTAFDSFCESGCSQRWYASMVADVKRLIIEGGVFAYPGNTKPGYENGHLRLIYEAIPMAFVMKAMGGADSDGTQSLLDISPTELHQKVPVFLGTKKLVDHFTQ